MKLFQYFAGNLLGENGKPAMDADKLKDMAHKTKLVDDKLTDTDINDIFNKVKGKAKWVEILFYWNGQQQLSSIAWLCLVMHWKQSVFVFSSTIDFDGFQDSLKEMAKKKYEDETKDANTALKKLEDQIIDNAQDFLGD